MRKLLVPLLLLSTVLAGAATRIVQDQCGPFTDVSPAICPYVLEMYYLGITAGTSPTTYSPDATVTRGQAAVFVSKGVNQAIARASRRAALGQSWTTSFHWHNGLGLTPLPGFYPDIAPVAADGADVWIGGDGIFRVGASDGRLLETWTTTHAGATSGASALLVAMGRVFVAETDYIGGDTISVIDPSLPPGAASVVVSGLTPGPSHLAFDGAQIFRSDSYQTVSIITPAATPPWSVTTVKGFQSAQAMVFDGANVWLYDVGVCALLRLGTSAQVLQTVALGDGCTAGPLVFDGSNVLVPVYEGLVAVRAADGAKVGEVPLISPPYALAFDGERLLVLCDGYFQSPDTLALIRAADLAILRVEPFNEGFGSLLLNSVASDGLNFWLSAATYDGFKLARY